MMKNLFLACFFALIAIPAVAGDQASYNAWVADFKNKASREGVSSRTLQKAFDGSRYLPRVIELDRKQPESKMTFAQYRERIVSAQRINQGRHEFRKHRALLNRVGEAYGVQPQYIVALWGIETNYGSNTGGFDVIDSLATLAYEGRRREFFSDELMNALKIIDGGHITAANMKGSWAGAMGQSQFMPSSFLNFAQDYNGDGRKDIWNTQGDVFASAANYLARSGWKGDERWGRRVILPNVTENIIGRDNKKFLNEWSRLGVRQADGSPLPIVQDMRAGLVAPDGIGGPLYLTYNNYDVIMKWNRSTYFATSVGLLADAIAAGQ
jgi:membrane-bound lytic murein transglycosylase B